MVVMFGGGQPANAGFDTFSETWVFDPVEERWTQLAFDGPAPTAVIGEQFAYHEGADVFVLHGGFSLSQNRLLNHTWHLDLGAGTWERVEPVDPPWGRNYNAFGHDPTAGVLVMSGGTDSGPDETWTYDPAARQWTFVEERRGVTSNPYARFAYVPELGALVRLGGLRPSPQTLWRYDVATDAWTQVTAENEGPVVSRHAMVAVPDLGLVVFGGLPAGAEGFTDELWVFDPSTSRWDRR